MGMKGSMGIGDRYVLSLVRDIWLPPAAYGLLMDRRIDVCHSIRRHLLLEKILPCCSLFKLVPGKCDLLTGGGNGPMSPKHQLMFDVQHFEKRIFRLDKHLIDWGKSTKLRFFRTSY